MKAQGLVAMGIGAGVSAMAASGALACSPIEPTRAEVHRGEQCALTHIQPQSPQFVRALEARDMGGGIVRQVIHNGICGSGERIVTYFDCATRTGAWLGGPVNGHDAPAAPMIGGAPVVSIEGYGIDDAFMEIEEKRLQGGPRPEAVLARAQALPWVAQSGPIQSPRMVMDGKRFDLNCGCKLFYPGGVN